jgi:hypothetical protein
MTGRLAIYNKALEHLGPVRLASLTENRPDRYELDAVYDATLASILEHGLWHFALRTVELDPDTAVEAGFGLPFVYTMPSDFVRLHLISPDENQDQDDRSFKHEGGYWRSEYSKLYATFVSNSVSYGLNLGAWPETVADAAGAELAYRSGLPITKDRGTKNDLLIVKKRMLIDAKRLNAVDERVRGKPLSSWASNRMAGARNQQRREST